MVQLDLILFFFLNISPAGVTLINAPGCRLNSEG